MIKKQINIHRWTSFFIRLLMKYHRFYLKLFIYFINDNYNVYITLETPVIAGYQWFYVMASYYRKKAPPFQIEL